MPETELGKHTTINLAGVTAISATAGLSLSLPWTLGSTQVQPPSGSFDAFWMPYGQGQAAVYDDDGTARNAMAKLGALLARTTPNEGQSFTLADTHLLFPNRLYNSFEMPTKLIKLRATLPQLLLRPDVYQYLRVAEGCRDALLCLGALLRSTTLRYAFKAAAFPHAAHLLQLEKKFGGQQRGSNSRRRPPGGRWQLQHGMLRSATARPRAPERRS